MKVTSPVGEFPYRLERVTLQGHRLVVHGRMGAWPANAELEGKDFIQLARVARVPVLVAGALGVILLARRLV